MTETANVRAKNENEALLSRRHVLHLGAVSGGALMLAGLPMSAWAEQAAAAAPVSDKDAHFFLVIHMFGGMDGSYLFDARPLEMTKNEKMQNYLGKEPVLWQGSNGVDTWATELVKPLEIYKNNFSVINGVLMATTFDGHDQNVNFLVTGNAFGGESYIPNLNAGTKTPLDALLAGFLPVQANNHASVVPMRLGAFNSLRAQMKVATALDGKSPVIEFIRSRMAALGQGPGRFSEGASALLKMHGVSEALYQKLVTVPDIAEDPAKDSTADSMRLAFEMFRYGIAKTAILSNIENFDTHAAADAKKQPELYTKAVASIEKVFKLLKETQYDQMRSYMDVTTVLISSEFGRTMRSPMASTVQDTGTDHNPLTNMMIVAGKGIKGGEVFGATDFQTSDEVLSGAHLALDSNKLKVMGRPFDFSTMKPSADKPAGLSLANYITADSVVNSLYGLFGVDKSHYRVVERNGPVAKTIF